MVDSSLTVVFVVAAVWRFSLLAQPVLAEEHQCLRGFQRSSRYESSKRLQKNNIQLRMHYLEHTAQVLVSTKVIDPFITEMKASELHFLVVQYCLLGYTR